MRIILAPLIIGLIVALIVDMRILQVVRKRCRSVVPARIHLCSSCAIYLVLIVALCMPHRGGSESGFLAVMWLLFTYLSVLCSKLLFVVVDLIACLPRLWKGKRIGGLSFAGGVMGVMLFLGMWWGALVNRYRIDVREVEVEVAGLPSAFDGYRIAQISDLHLGTYGGDTTYVNHLADVVNGLNTDVIVFTGDIVNRKTKEIYPHVSALACLDAPDGVYSILGNHDYGDYSDWDSAEAKKANLEELISVQKSMGWKLLLNEHDVIYRRGDSIVMVGVENVGDPPFATYGSLEDAYPTLSDGNTKILLSHNPAHWENDIRDSDTTQIALTLSGHTHAMQIEVLGVSPAVMRYKYWGGLYDSPSHPNAGKLYVNIGIGTVGMPMRFGATPEVTVLTLKRK